MERMGRDELVDLKRAAMPRKAFNKVQEHISKCFAKPRVDPAASLGVWVLVNLHWPIRPPFV